MSAGATQSLAIAFGLGTFVSAICSRYRVPAVLPLLIVGVACGDAGLELVDVRSLGSTFNAMIAISIGLLVFDGGLSLDRKELGRAPRVVFGLLTVGALITWMGCALAAVAILGVSWPIALVLGSILIVTGPTVIQPVLRQVRVSPALRSALSAEAVLLDPIGVLVAVTTLEFVASYAAGGTESAWPRALGGFALPVVAGAAIGAAAGGAGLLWLRHLSAAGGAKGAGAAHPLRRLLNLAAMAVCMLAIGAGEMVASDGGLVAATVAGVILANSRVIANSAVREFKEQLSTILVGMLFVLIASGINPEKFQGLGLPHLLFVVAVLFAVRPVNAFVGCAGSALPARDRAFMALFAPRGIVAASLAAIAAATLVARTDPEDKRAIEEAELIELLVFAVIAASVLWATVAAWPLARVLRVLAGPPRGVLIVGAHRLGREVAAALKSEGIPVYLIDTNPRHADLARREGLDVGLHDATDLESLNTVAREREIGWVFAWTGNDDVDRVVGRWAIGHMSAEQVQIGVPRVPETDATNGNSGGVRAIERLLHDGLIAVRVQESAEGAVPIIALRGGAPVVVTDTKAPAQQRTRWVTVIQTAAPAEMATRAG